MYSLALLSEHEDNKQLTLALNILAKEFDLPRTNFKFDPKTVGLGSVICSYKHQKQNYEL